MPVLHATRRAQSIASAASTCLISSRPVYSPPVKILLVIRSLVVSTTRIADKSRVVLFSLGFSSLVSFLRVT